MTTILLNQEELNNLAVNKQYQKLAITVAMAITLSACGGAADKIIDEIDTNRSTNVSYINALDSNTTFYLKSAIYNEGVFDSKFRSVELMSAEVSEVIKHDWINGANESVFGIEKSITNASRVKHNIDLKEQVDYWAVAWGNSAEDHLTVFERNTNNKAGMYSIRLLTTSEMAVKQPFSNDIIATTEPGVVTASFEVDGCSGLRVGGNKIDLCAIGTVGHSYLAVVSIEGQIVVTQE